MLFCPSDVARVALGCNRSLGCASLEALLLTNVVSRHTACCLLKLFKSVLLTPKPHFSLGSYEYFPIPTC
jgi:hypothetical protein